MSKFRLWFEHHPNFSNSFGFIIIRENSHIVDYIDCDICLVSVNALIFRLSLFKHVFELGVGYKTKKIQDLYD